MNNTVPENCSSVWSYSDTSHITYFIWRICGFIFIIFGIPGHIFHILIILSKKNRKEPTSLYIVAMATSETIFLSGLYCLKYFSKKFHSSVISRNTSFKS